MSRKILLLSFVLCSLFSQARIRKTEVRVEKKDSTSVLLQRYLAELDSLVAERDTANQHWTYSTPNAYYFELLSTSTLYNAPMHQQMGFTDSISADAQVQRVSFMNRLLSQLYVRHPELVRQTENAIKEQKAIRTDVAEKLDTKDKLADKVSLSTLGANVEDEQVKVITRRPNFWKFSGNVSLSFAQNHVSDNWYQGGDDNQYAGNSSLTLYANFNNQKKITWNNTLWAQLGFQTAKTDKNRTFRPTSNLLKYQTNWGYQMYKTLSYSGQITLQTQIVPNYNYNSDVVTTDFLAPLDVTIAPGIRYNISYGKKKRFTGYLNVAPLAYGIRYVHRDDCTTRYGLDPKHHAKHTFGPNVTLNTKWVICNQINWTSNIYWYSNLSFTRIEWTNTVNFTVSKLISAQFNFYPRYEDSNKQYKNKHGKYLMFKEWMSLGLSYNF